MTLRDARACPACLAHTDFRFVNIIPLQLADAHEGRTLVGDERAAMGGGLNGRHTLVTDERAPLGGGLNGRRTFVGDERAPLGGGLDGRTFVGDERAQLGGGLDGRPIVAWLCLEMFPDNVVSVWPLQSSDTRGLPIFAGLETRRFNSFEKTRAGI